MILTYTLLDPAGRAGRQAHSQPVCAAAAAATPRSLKNDTYELVRIIAERAA